MNMNNFKLMVILMAFAITQQVFASVKQCGELGFIPQELLVDEAPNPAFITRKTTDSGEILVKKYEIIPLNESVDAFLSSKQEGAKICITGRAPNTAIRKFFVFSVE